jgi:DNA processing protein
MDNCFCWHKAAYFSGKINFTFTRHHKKEKWVDALESQSVSKATITTLFTPLSPSPKCSFVRLIDEDYPSGLKDLPYAPPILYYQGQLQCLKRMAVTIVGSRKSTWLGRQFATQLAEYTTSKGYCVVSGLAYGIDEAAHRGGLRHTVGIMGQGILAERRGARKKLCTEIIRAGGLLISEFPPSMSAQIWTFLHRNRIMAWLADIFVLVEAPVRSGAMNTTRIALDTGVPLYVVPHHPLVESAQGGLELLLSGATPLISVEQIPSPTDFSQIRNKSEASTQKH